MISLSFVDWLLVGLGSIVLLSSVLIALWLIGRNQWQSRAERIQLKREVRQAELRLHGLTRSAFEAMLDAARRQSSKDGD